MAGQKAVCVLLESKSKEVKGVINFEQVIEGMLRLHDMAIPFRFALALVQSKCVKATCLPSNQAKQKQFSSL